MQIGDQPPERHRVALTAVGADQPGIVAALTGVLEDLGCNLEDSTMSILRGQFAVLLVLAVHDGLNATSVESALLTVADRLDLTVVVRPLREANDPPTGTAAEATEATTFAFSIHGSDRPGIVRRAADAMASAGGNIVDLSTRLVGTSDTPAYVLTLTVAFAPRPGLDDSVSAVCASVEEFGVLCRAHRVEIDVL